VPKVSLVIPVYNESAQLERFLREIDSLKLPVEKELVFVNDCSTDGSGKILDGFRFNSPNVQIIHQPKNCGKGAAVALGISKATGDWVGVQDADFEYSMQDIPMLLEPLMNGSADVVFGSRFKKTVNQVHRTFHYLINRFLTMLSNMLSGIYLTDMETCYKFGKSEIFQNIVLTSQRFGFEPEITAKLAMLKVRIVELPISYFPRSYIEGKKITWKDGVAAIRHIIVFNLFHQLKQSVKPTMPVEYIPRNRQWL
jgi:glycosyltransferase involved in cell wall biosynthesis